MTRKTITYEFWRGSVDGAPVMALAAGLGTPSTNRKTGVMVQTYILRRDMKPIEASNTGADSAICGDCPLRPTMVAPGAAVCYVNKGWLTGMWESWRDGNVPRISPDKLGDIIEASGLGVRQGAYGDPAVVPTSVWAQLDHGRGTSYTHQWRTANPSLALFAMASVQSTAEMVEANAMGYRTYRVDLDGIGAQPNEIECPNTTRGVTCAQCGLCNGNRSGAKNIFVKPIRR